MFFLFFKKQNEDGFFFSRERKKKYFEYFIYFFYFFQKGPWNFLTIFWVGVRVSYSASMKKSKFLFIFVDSFLST
jgi:hypothetical protein